MRVPPVRTTIIHEAKQCNFKVQRNNMKIKNILIILSIFWVQDTYGWLFNLDLHLNSALRPGGAYTANKGSYLQDSFRTEVLTPTMMDIEKELKANRRNDFIVEALLAVGLLFNIIVSLYLLIKTRRIRSK